jgi:hypothetical protein
MKPLAVTISVLIVSLSACASAGEPEPSLDDEFTLPPASDPMASWSSKSQDPLGTSLTGTLGFDDIEGGCVFLGAADGRRYEVIYPDGWSIDRTSAVLRGPEGQIAQAGDTLTVQGSIATDRSSICQIGPIFVATDVEIEPT